MSVQITFSKGRYYVEQDFYLPFECRVIDRKTHKIIKEGTYEECVHCLSSLNKEIRLTE